MLNERKICKIDRFEESDNHNFGSYFGVYRYLQRKHIG